MGRQGKHKKKTLVVKSCSHSLWKRRGVGVGGFVGGIVTSFLSVLRQKRKMILLCLISSWFQNKGSWYSVRLCGLREQHGLAVSTSPTSGWRGVFLLPATPGHPRVPTPALCSDFPASFHTVLFDRKPPSGVGVMFHLLMRLSLNF